LFPGILNKKLEQIEKELLITQNEINKIMNSDRWDIAPLNDNHIEQLACYGDIMSFNNSTARRLISCLATELGKQKQINLDKKYE